MSCKQFFAILILALLSGSLFLGVATSPPTQAEATLNVYFGVDVGYEVNAQTAKAAIDQVSNFTNFFVLGNYMISRNIPELNETLQHAYDKGMHFICYPPTLGFDPELLSATKDWLSYAKANWEDHLIGFLYPWEDEPGGHQLDRKTSYYPVVNMTATNYTDAENQFLNSDWFKHLNNIKQILDYPVFTSDYALYWFDYKGGYDGLLAEFGWNYSAQLNAAFCRGAATAMNKQWGAIITFTYTDPPYIESATALYRDLMYAYDNGAKYIVVLDTNEDWTGGCLTEEHFQAMKDFWTYIQNNPPKTHPKAERVAYELPEAYAYGFRGPLDKIWGVWEADITSFLISESVGLLLQKYGSKLDVIYEDPTLPNRTLGYNKTIHWDDYQAFAAEWPWYTPLPELQDESSPEPTNSANPQTTPALDANRRLVTLEYLMLIAAAAAAAGFSAAVFIYERKRFRRQKLKPIK